VLSSSNRHLLGQPDAKTDESYTAAAVAAVESGINVMDAAINYRFHAASAASGGHQATCAKGFEREEIVVCTKGGYLTPDGAMPADPTNTSSVNTFSPECSPRMTLRQEGHCMTPKFLKNQLGRSFENLGVDCVDVYYLHNPETQLSEVTKEEFSPRPRGIYVSRISRRGERNSVFRHGHVERLSAGRPRARRHAARRNLASSAGNRGRPASLPVRAVPFNLGMTEALTLGNQSLRGHHRTIMEAASELDITFIASASLLQGQVAKNLPVLSRKLLAWRRRGAGAAIRALLS